jgi:hypothetical protein
MCALVVETPIPPFESGVAFDQRVTDLVEDHLGDRIVRVEARLVPEQQNSVARGRRIGIRRAFDAEPDLRRRGDPDFVEGIDVAVSDDASFQRGGV